MSDDPGTPTDPGAPSGPLALLAPVWNWIVSLLQRFFDVLDMIGSSWFLLTETLRWVWRAMNLANHELG